MAAELRQTGISVVGDMPWGTHFCYFYETKQDLLDILVPYFKAGLENKEFCLWVISNSELLTAQEATSALRNALPDLDRYVTERSIEVVGHDEWFLNGGTFALHKVAHRFKEKLDEALARGYAGMRVNGSPAWLYDEDQKVFRKFEAELDKLFPNERIIASCTYPLATIRGDEVFDAARTHQFAIARRQGAWEIIETPELIQAKAEIKRLNEELEHRVIERTRELAAANEKLRREINERERAEDALRRSEDHLRLVIDAIPTMAWSLGSDGVVDFLNQRWVDYTGLSLEQFIEEPTRPIHPEDIPRVVERWRAEMAVGEPYDDEMRLQRADGEYRWFLIRTAPLRDERGNLVKWYGVSIDIEERKRAEEKLGATNVQLRALSESLRSAREQEGARIAREIHDELGAALMSLKWDLEELDKIFTEAGDQAQLSALQEKTAAMTKLVDNTINVVRRIASELRPSILDDLGLVEAIEWQAQKFQAQTGIICRCDCALENVELGQDQSTAAFRILQEALTNILRHAQATRVDITVRKEAGQFVLTISDNGRGITEEEKSGRLSLGLLGMRERAHLVGGRIDINGVKGQGTVVIVRVPFSG
ncbi:MAG: MEDS domain-containing protein [Pyrinomonadaceae bacterium]